MFKIGDRVLISASLAEHYSVEDTGEVVGHGNDFLFVLPDGSDNRRPIMASQKYGVDLIYESPLWEKMGLVGIVSWEVGQDPDAEGITEMILTGGRYCYYWYNGSDMINLAFFRDNMIASDKGDVSEACEDFWARISGSEFS